MWGAAGQPPLITQTSGGRVAGLLPRGVPRLLLSPLFPPLTPGKQPLTPTPCSISSSAAPLLRHLLSLPSHSASISPLGMTAPVASLKRTLSSPPQEDLLPAVLGLIFLGFSPGSADAPRAPRTGPAALVPLTVAGAPAPSGSDRPAPTEGHSLPVSGLRKRSPLFSAPTPSFQTRDLPCLPAPAQDLAGSWL